MAASGPPAAERLDQVERDWYEMAFRLRLLEDRGIRFQDFFGDIMELRYPGDFVRVRAAGPHGDFKCDGYLPSERTIFQCYGPTDMDATGVAKMDSDFRGALLHWRDDMDAWAYVHNHPDGVTGAGILPKKQELERESGHEVRIDVWSSGQLRALVFQLAREDIRLLLGPAPSRRDVIALRYEPVAALVESIQTVASVTAGPVVAPSPHKLRHNHLSAFVERLLLVGMERELLVRAYLAEQSDPQLPDRIASAFNSRFLQLNAQGLSADDIFAGLQAFVTGDLVPTPGIQAGTLALLAYLFERCDIFDDAPERPAGR